MNSRMSRFAAGALLAASVAAAQTAKVDFQKEIAPILEQSCTECHHAGTSSSNLQLTSREELLKSGTVIPRNPMGSFFYTCLENGWMPPGQKLTSAQLELVRNWIKQGVDWPAGVKLKVTAKQTAAKIAPSAEMENVRQIRERILKAKGGSDAYSVTVPNTTISYQMKPIPAGEFSMGSDKAGEGPPHKVKVDGFWMQAHEVTWDEYRLFMFANQAGEITHKDAMVDAVSRPTRPYVEMSFGMGINGFPAISMTQHAANKYAEWLSAKTGEFYRLPTEAEWEYACRANSATAPQPLEDYAVFAGDTDGQYKKVGTKKPNAFGLFDMLGNVMEWTLDQDVPYQAGEQANPQINPWMRPSKPYPITARGGSWNDPAEKVTCTVRVGSDASWKQQDPQLPKSIWYETDAQWLGFRLVRTAKVPTEEEMYRYWNNGVFSDEQ